MQRRTLNWTGLLLAMTAGAGAATFRPHPTWSAAERKAMAELSLEQLPPLPADPTNRVADDPRAVALGHALFFDARFSANGKVSCATCHDPAREFQDGTPLGHGIGTTGRRTMPVVGTARGAWLFWDGRKDSQWSQALGPWESPVEHGGTRAQYTHLVARHYRAEYQALFGPLPDLSRIPERAGPVDDPAARQAWAALQADSRRAINQVYANLGKVVAAYERRLEYGPSRFDRYVGAVLAAQPVPAALFTAEEEAGLRLFLGKARCTSCHSGPLLSDGQFHNIGVPELAGASADSGRLAGVRQVLVDEFNCRGPYSDAPDQCDELEYAVTTGDSILGAVKTPSLRNVAQRAPYMHRGQFTTLEQVIEHYDQARAAVRGHSELVPLHLTEAERRQLVAFLRTLSGPVAAPDSLLCAPHRRESVAAGSH